MSQGSGREASLVRDGAPVDPPPAPDVLRHLTRPDRERKGAKTRHLRRRRWPHGRHAGRIADPQMGSGVADGRACVTDVPQTRPRAQQWSVYQERCRGWREGCRLTGPWGPAFSPSGLSSFYLPERSLSSALDGPGATWAQYPAEINFLNFFFLIPRKRVIRLTRKGKKKIKQSYKSLFLLNPEVGGCFVPRVFYHDLLWVTGFSQSLISGAFENQIESSMNVRTPTASSSPILKTDCSRNDPGENQCQKPSRSRKAPTVNNTGRIF